MTLFILVLVSEILSSTEISLWLVLDYGTIFHLMSLATLRVTYCYGYVVNSKHFYSDSHIPLFCFSFYRAMHYNAKRGLAIACRLSVRL